MVYLVGLTIIYLIGLMIVCLIGLEITFILVINIFVGISISIELVDYFFNEVYWLFCILLHDQIEFYLLDWLVYFLLYVNCCELFVFNQMQVVGWDQPFVYWNIYIAFLRLYQYLLFNQLTTDLMILCDVINETYLSSCFLIYSSVILTRGFNLVINDCLISFDVKGFDAMVCKDDQLSCLAMDIIYLLNDVALLFFSIQIWLIEIYLVIKLYINFYQNSSLVNHNLLYISKSIFNLYNKSISSIKKHLKVKQVLGQSDMQVQVEQVMTSQQLTLQQKQKLQMFLLSTYNESMGMLKQNNKKKGGKQKLLYILSCQIICQPQLLKLQKSVLLSLGNTLIQQAHYQSNVQSLSKQQFDEISQNYQQALGYYFRVLELEKDVVMQCYGQQGGDPNNTLSQGYIFIIRMIKLLEDLSKFKTQHIGLIANGQTTSQYNTSSYLQFYGKLSIYLLKRALLVCPDMWRQQCFLLLQQKYDQLNMVSQKNDLIRTRQNQWTTKKIIQQQQLKRSMIGEIAQICYPYQNSYKQFEQQKNKKSSQVLQVIRLKLNRLQPGSNTNPIVYSLFEYLLTSTYVLLKCQKKRNFNKKRYFHKKYDSFNLKWISFLEHYDLLKTKVQLVYAEVQQRQTQKPIIQQSKPIIQSQLVDRWQQPNQNQNCLIKSDSQQVAKSDQDLIKQLSSDILRIKYTKKKKSKPNPAQKAPVPSQPLQSKPISNIIKKSPYPQKQVYDSIRNYFQQAFIKNKVNKQQLEEWLRLISQKDYEECFRMGFGDKQTGKENDDEEDERGEPQLKSNKISTAYQAKEDSINQTINIPNQPCQLNLTNLPNISNVPHISNFPNQQSSIKTQQQSKQLTLLSNLLGRESTNKLNFKQRKLLQLKRLKFHQYQFDQFINYLNNYRNEINLVTQRNDINQKVYTFFNVFQLVEVIVSWITNLADKPITLWERQIYQFQHQSQLSQTQILSNSAFFPLINLSVHRYEPIKKLIAKNVIKSYSVYKGSFLAFQSQSNNIKLSHSQLLLKECLINHLEWIISKQDKSRTQFLKNQQQKQIILKEMIVQQSFLTGPLISISKSSSTQTLLLTFLWSKLLIKFYSNKNNFNLNLIFFYKDLCIFYLKKLKQQLNQSEQVILSTNALMNLNFTLNKNDLMIYIHQVTEQSIIIQIDKSISKVQNGRTATQMSLNNQSLNHLVYKQVQKSYYLDDIQYLVKNLQIPLEKQVSFNFVSQVFIRVQCILSKFCIQLEQQSQQKDEFSIRSLQALTQKMKINKIINLVYERFKSNNQQMIKAFELFQQRRKILFMLIKVAFLGALQYNDHCLRLILYVSSLITKQLSDQEKLSQNYMLKMITLLYTIISLSNSMLKVQNISLILKKFYQHILSKSLINVVYKNSIQQWKNDFKLKDKLIELSKSNKHDDINNKDLKIINLKTKFILLQERLSLSKQMIQQSQQDGHANKDQSLNQFLINTHQITIEKVDLVDRIMSIVYTIYFTTDFTPKKLEDCLSYFLFLSRYYSDQFQFQQLQLTNGVIKVFKKCYAMFADKKNQFFLFCNQFIQFRKKIDKLWEGTIKQPSKQIIDILKGNSNICQCCKVEKIHPHLNYKQIVYVMAKFFQSNSYEQQKQNSIVGTTNDKQKQSQGIDSYMTSSLDQQYFTQYLLLDVKNMSGWIHYIRIHSLKSYYYFDSLIGVQSIEKYRSKFLFTKRIINFIKQNILPQDSIDVNAQLKPLQQFTTRTINILNILKLKQRQFFMILKKIEMNWSDDRPNRQVTQLVNKYYEGVKTVSNKYKDGNVTSQYLGIVELKLINLDKLLNTYIHHINQNHQPLDNIANNQPLYSVTSVQLHYSVTNTQLNQSGTNFDMPSQSIKQVYQQLPEELILKTKQLQLEIKSTILNLEKYQKRQQLSSTHLQQDFVVQFYIMIAKIMQAIIKAIIKGKKHINYLKNKNIELNKDSNKLILKQYLDFVSFWLQNQNQIAKQQKYIIKFQNLSSIIKTNNIQQQNISQKIDQLMPLNQIIQQKQEKFIDIQVENRQNRQNQILEIINLPSNNELSQIQIQNQDQIQKQKPQQSQQQVDQQDDQPEPITQKHSLRQKRFKFKPLEGFMQRQNTRAKKQLNPKQNIISGIKHQVKQKRNQKIVLNLKDYIKRMLKYGQQQLRIQAEAIRVQQSRVYGQNRVYGQRREYGQLDDLQSSIVGKIQIFLNGITSLFKSLPKQQIKRFKYRRSITTSHLYISQLYLNYLNDPSLSLQILKQYYNIRSDDIVFVYSYYDNKSTEKNLRLAQFYNRTLVSAVTRVRFVQHLVHAFQMGDNVQALVVLIRKLGKLVGADTQNDSTQVYYLLILYYKAVNAYITIVTKFSLTQPLNEKYQKLIIQFKNKIRKSIDIRIQEAHSITPYADIKQQKQKALRQNYYYQRIQSFIQSYQKKYERKVKLKKTKKQKQALLMLQQNNVQKCIQTQNKQTQKKQIIYNVKYNQFPIIDQHLIKNHNQVLMQQKIESQINLLTHEHNFKKIQLNVIQEIKIQSQLDYLSKIVQVQQQQSSQKLKNVEVAIQNKSQILQFQQKKQKKIRLKQKKSQKKQNQIINIEQINVQQTQVKQKSKKPFKQQVKIFVDSHKHYLQTDKHQQIKKQLNIQYDSNSQYLQIKQVYIKPDLTFTQIKQQSINQAQQKAYNTLEAASNQLQRLTKRIVIQKIKQKKQKLVSHKKQKKNDQSKIKPKKQKKEKESILIKSSSSQQGKKSLNLKQKMQKINIISNQILIEDQYSQQQINPTNLQKQNRQSQQDQKDNESSKKIKPNQQQK